MENPWNIYGNLWKIWENVRFREADLVFFDIPGISWDASANMDGYPLGQICGVHGG